MTLEAVRQRIHSVTIIIVNKVKISCFDIQEYCDTQMKINKFVEAVKACWDNPWSIEWQSNACFRDTVLNLTMNATNVDAR